MIRRPPRSTRTSTLFPYTPLFRSAAGVHESIYSLLMMRDGFLAASANIETLDPGAEGFPILRERADNVTVNRVMSNSFGFGGTNASLIFQRYAACPAEIGRAHV